jgi:hypothetical protein
MRLKIMVYSGQSEKKVDEKSGVTQSQRGERNVSRTEIYVNSTKTNQQSKNAIRKACMKTGRNVVNPLRRSQPTEIKKS